MIPIKRDSTTHVALLYLKMKNSPVDKSKLYNFSPIKFSAVNVAEKALSKLFSLGFASKEESRYTITDEGKQALYLIVKQQKKQNYV